jgi:hypothetical protein
MMIVRVRKELTSTTNIKRPKMKRKDPPCRSDGLDPRDFAWHKFHRDQFPNIGDRVWLKSEQSYGRIVVDPSADASQEGQGPSGHATTEDHDDDDGPCRDEVNNNDPDDKNRKASSMDEPCRGSSLRMVRLENDQATTVPLRRPHDAVRMFAPPTIIICHDTDDFRRLAQTQDLGDTNNDGIGVLEIGCSTGQTSRIVWPRLLRRHDDCDHHRWMGWDTGQTMVDKVQNEIDQYIIDNSRTGTSGRLNKKETLVCRKIDAMVDPETAWQMAIDHFCSPTTSKSSNLTVLIDIGGNRNAHAVAKILQWALELPGHGCTNNKTVIMRMVIIKSEEMFALDDPMKWFLATRQPRLNVRSSSTTISTAAAGSSSIGIKTFPSHPLKAPKRYSPDDPTRFVCRYHNYHPKGCQKGETCQFDHTHCHWCLQAGHMALDCPTRDE